MSNAMREALIVAEEALREIALTGLTGPCTYTDDETQAMQARLARRFIGIAGMALEPVRTALAAQAVEAKSINLREVGLSRDTKGMCIVTVNGREAIRDNGDVISHFATLDWFAARSVEAEPAEPTDSALLGLATTGELLEELKSRFQVNCEDGLEYRAVGKRANQSTPESSEAMRRDAERSTANLSNAEKYRSLLGLAVADVKARGSSNGRDAPGHRHLIPGIWNSDNGVLAGKPCAWCSLWNEAKASIASDAKGGA